MHNAKLIFLFKWNNHSITYLGIQLPSYLADLNSTNHLPLIQNLVNDLKKWSTRLFSWFGRAAIIKMNVLPRLLYLLQTVPVKLPPAFFITYRRTCSDFFWGKLCPRISYSRLTIPKLKGGIGLPDIRKYQQACHLTRIIDWNIHHKTKAWVHLEHSLSPIPLSQIPWVSPNRIPLAHSPNTDFLSYCLYYI